MTSPADTVSPPPPTAWQRIGRWLRRLGLATVSLLAVLVLTGAIFEARARRRALREHPAPGTLVDIGGRRMHLDCRGTGTPTVVFESGLDLNGSLAWTTVHDSVAATTRACAYDRAGIMWSDPKRGGQDGAAVAEDLHATLTAAGEAAPFVLVGHSLGGPYIVTYTARFGDEVAGLVFVDASHPDQLDRLAEFLPESPAILLGAYSLLGTLSWTGAARLLVPRIGATGAVPVGAEDKVGAFYGTSFRGSLSELHGIRETFKTASLASRSLGDRPAIVLVGLKPLSDDDLTAMQFTAEQGVRLKATWQKLQEEMAGWSTRGRLELLHDADHYVQYDRPDRVIAAVRAVVAQVREAPAASAATP